MASDGIELTYFVIAFGFVLIFYLLFMISRYRKFRPNMYVIHLRNGRVKRASLGGSLFLIPLIDEVLVIPVSAQQLFLDVEVPNAAINVIVSWKVTEPTVAFNKFSWIPSSPDHVETIIKERGTSIIRDLCSNMTVEDIEEERAELLNEVIDGLQTLTREKGIMIESVKIRGEKSGLDAAIELARASLEMAKETGNQSLTDNISGVLEFLRSQKE